MNLKELREFNLLTQKDLSERLGVTQQYISKLENGNINGLTLGKFNKLSKILKVTEPELIVILRNI